MKFVANELSLGSISSGRSFHWMDTPSALVSTVHSSEVCTWLPLDFGSRKLSCFISLENPFWQCCLTGTWATIHKHPQGTGEFLDISLPHTGAKTDSHRTIQARPTTKHNSRGQSTPIKAYTCGALWSCVVQYGETLIQVFLYLIPLQWPFLWHRGQLLFPTKLLLSTFLSVYLIYPFFRILTLIGNGVLSVEP